MKDDTIYKRMTDLKTTSTSAALHEVADCIIQLEKLVKTALYTANRNSRDAETFRPLAETGLRYLMQMQQNLLDEAKELDKV
tara:strand:- start:573 stop:818 length:246 start_codon:yes stop_codon:yes gene_type:complete